MLDFSFNYLVIMKNKQRRIMKKFICLISLCMFSYTISECMTEQEKQLFDAIKNNKLNIVQRLISKGVNVNVKDNIGRTPLMIASQNKAKENIVNELLKADGIDIDEQDNDGWTVLIYVSFSGNLSLVKKLIKQKADLDKQTTKKYETEDVTVYKGTTALMIAIEEDEPNIAIALINAGANVNLKNDDGWTAFMKASYNENLYIVKKLIKAGADINIRNNKKETALIIAIEMNHTDIAQELIHAGANVNLKNDDGWTAFMEASYNGNIYIVKKLIDAGADINIINNEKETALTIAIEEGHTDIAIALIKAGANVNLKNINGQTALDIAKDKKNQAIIELLEKKPTDKNLIKSLQKLQRSLTSVGKLLK